MPAIYNLQKRDGYFLGFQDLIFDVFGPTKNIVSES